MIPSSTRMCLGSAILAGLLLASSLTALASGETSKAAAITPSLMKPALLASSVLSSGTYTETVRKQMQWISTPVVAKIQVKTDPAIETLVPPSVPVAVATQQTQPAKPAAVELDKTITEPVQVSETPQVSRSSNSALIDNARSLVGVPYAFGGTSRSGFDCSGYTQYVFNGSGIQLPRTASSQFSVGSSISRGNLQAGDLVFFATYEKGPSHVGIYIGGGSFIHASNKGVRTASLSDNYYAGRYLGARRVG